MASNNNSPHEKASTSERASGRRRTWNRRNRRDQSHPPPISTFRGRFGQIVEYLHHADEFSTVPRWESTGEIAPREVFTLRPTMVVRPRIDNPPNALTFISFWGRPRELFQYRYPNPLQPVAEADRLPYAYNGWAEFWIFQFFDWNLSEGEIPQEMGTPNSLPVVAEGPFDPATFDIPHYNLAQNEINWLEGVNFDVLTAEDQPDTYSDFEDLIPG